MTNNTSEAFDMVKKKVDDALGALNNLPKYGANEHAILSCSFWYTSVVGKQLLKQLELAAKEFSVDGTLGPILGSGISEFSEGYFENGAIGHFNYLYETVNTRYNHYLNFAANNPDEVDTIEGLSSEILHVFSMLIEYVKSSAEDKLADTTTTAKEGVAHVGENG